MVQVDLQQVGHAKWPTTTYYRDAATDVMYIKIEDSISVMMDPKTGGPLTFSAYVEYAQRKGMM